jgi:hypothetical protein
MRTQLSCPYSVIFYIFMLWRLIKFSSRILRFEFHRYSDSMDEIAALVPESNALRADESAIPDGRVGCGR